MSALNAINVDKVWKLNIITVIGLKEYRNLELQELAL